MNKSFLYIEEYFNTLFVERNLDKINEFLHPNYWDDDYGVAGTDHIEGTKDYLLDLFNKIPKVGVKVNKVDSHDNVIIAYLEWYYDIQDTNSLWQKGVGTFLIESGRIIKRNTFIYYKNEFTN